MSSLESLVKSPNFKDCLKRQSFFVMQDRNLPEDQDLYSWKDLEDTTMPKSWLMDDYEYQTIKTPKSYTVSEIKTYFKKWCKETKRSGGVLVHGSIQEFFNYLKDR